MDGHQSACNSIFFCFEMRLKSYKILQISSIPNKVKIIMTITFFLTNKTTKLIVVQVIMSKRICAYFSCFFSYTFLPYCLIQILNKRRSTYTKITETDRPVYTRYCSNNKCHEQFLFKKRKTKNKNLKQNLLA